MGGGLMQLVAYGAQDIYLTGSPQITFFKVVYRRHTNFAMESIEQTFNGSVGFGNRVTCTVSRNGDLVHRMWLQADVTLLNAANATNAYNDNMGHQLIDNVELEIGGQRIDKHYADWLEVWSELTVSSEHASGYATMVGDALASGNGGNNTPASHTLYVPLQFWFCRNPGLALPLIALQYHEVKVNLTFGTLVVRNNTNDITPALSGASLWCDYIYLDTDERRRFAQVSHEYLIEQVQFTGDEAVTANSTNNVRLNFNHPVKELVWVQVDAEANAKNARFGAYEPLGDGTKLQLNGHDRFAARNAKYFTHVQPYQHHSNVPNSKNINVYSFALRPEEHQPSGTCNFSRIDNATLSVKTGAAASALKVFAVNYNVLRVMSGMGGLAYSN